MATSKIKAPFKIGTMEYVDTFPFTPTKDGIMVAEVEGNNAPGENTMFYLNVGTRPLCRISFSLEWDSELNIVPHKGRRNTVALLSKQCIPS